MLTFRNDFGWTKVPWNPELQDCWQTICLSSFEEMALVIESVVGGMADMGYPPKTIFGTRLALEEAICNAIKHGHQNDPTKVVEVRYRIGQDHFLVEVEDQGRGFNPSQVPDPTCAENLAQPGGRGLLLIRHYATWVRFNKLGNCIAFCIPSARVPMEPTKAERTTTGRPSMHSPLARASGVSQKIG
jgi:serine/threonine-protein kinase RsbW